MNALTDFNDLHQMAGAEAVRNCIDTATPVAPAQVFEELPAAEVVRAKHEVVLLNGMDLQPEPVSWLWPGWLALGKLHILAGAPGQGKTTIALACGFEPDEGPLLDYLETKFRTIYRL